jgi:hypothetical protein
MGTLLILNESAHADLADLDRDGALAHAQCCLCHSAENVFSMTPWGVQVADVVSSTAFALELTSLSHTKGARILRRLELNEEPRPTDSAPPERALIPSSWRAPCDAPAVAGDLGSGSVQNPQLGTGAVGTGNLQGQAVTPQKRSLLTQVTGSSPSIPSGGRTTITLTHGLGFRPLAVPQSGHSFIIASVISMTTSTITILLVNAGQESASTTLTVDYF